MSKFGSRSDSDLSNAHHSSLSLPWLLPHVIVVDDVVVVVDDVVTFVDATFVHLLVVVTDAGVVTFVHIVEVVVVVVTCLIVLDVVTFKVVMLRLLLFRLGRYIFWRVLFT